MKTNLILKNLIGLVLALVSTNALAVDLTKDFDSLGGNDKIIKRAKDLNSNRTVRVVQNRTVDRRLRLELAGLFGGVAGGNSYLSTSQYGGQLEFHINPKISLGARYYGFNNGLTAEGERVYDSSASAAARGGRALPVPYIDHPISSYMGTLTWYPLYGKLNLFDMGVTQFDLYAVGGAGQVELRSGSSETYTAGGGIGFWLTQHISARFELRWQTYSDIMPNGEARDLNLTVGNMALGILL